MKTIFLSIGLLVLRVMLVNGQDTTNVPIRQGDPQPRQSPTEIHQNNLKDMVKIDAREVPVALKNVLQSKEYRGDKLTYYKHKERDEYTVEVQAGEVTQFYLFDKNGKPIHQQN